MIGFFVYRSMQTQKMREMHVAVMNQFQDIEKDEVVGKFWACLLGAGVDPAIFPEQPGAVGRIEGAFGADPKNYPTKVREECTPKAIDAKHKVECITAPGGRTTRRSRNTPRASPIWRRRSTPGRRSRRRTSRRREVGAKVGTDGAAWHSFAGGKPANDVVAYDRFLHCAVPGVDKMKDGQALVEFLFKQCKDREVSRPARTASAARRSPTETAAIGDTKDSRPPSGKLAADDRELSAFDDCLRKAARASARDDSEEVGRAWLDVHGSRSQGPRSRQRSARATSSQIIVSSI